MNFNKNLINFFEKHNLYDEEMFKYFRENTTMIDYKDPDQRKFIGRYTFLDRNKKLKNIHIVLPYIYDEITMLISIHELIHGIELYKKLNKKVKTSDDCEILPMLYEKIYMEENKSEKLENYQEYLNSHIGKDDQKYLLGLAVRDELYKNYAYDMTKIQKKSKQLVKKYKKQLNEG